jgi:[methyl-Co(III) methanol-specific corrinoid protein]:coenzyme M methyltransferase
MVRRKTIEQKLKMGRSIMDEMTLKERLLNALEGKKVDKVPVCSVTQTGIVELMDEVGAP